MSRSTANPSTVTLYRPVGEAELDLIAASGYRRFPPRLPEQPIFYPVCNEEYAVEIAERWNARDEGVGYVTRFSVLASYLEGFERQVVGARHHEEYWIPADELVVVAFDEDADEHGRRDDLVASGTVEPAPDWLSCRGSKWVLRIDEHGVRHQSELRKP